MLEKLPKIIGHAIQGIRPGVEGLLYHQAFLEDVPETLVLESPAFDAPFLPQRFTADGDGLSPPFIWSGVPAGAKSLLLVIEDADSPTPAPLVHAIVYDLPPRDGRLLEGEIKPTEDTPGQTGLNSFLSAGYLPPDPPPGHGPHHYVAQLYALDAPSGLTGHPGRPAIKTLLDDHAIARGVASTIYERK